MIQARGLAAEEFLYEINNKNYNSRSIKIFLKKILKKFLYKKYLSVESYAYKRSKYIKNMSIEAVSPALKEYLVSNFGADRSSIYVSSRDIPKIFNKNKVLMWRKEVRKELNINNNKYIYCYSGSARPWQCVDSMILFAKEKIISDKNAFFMFLSQDDSLFKQKLINSGVSPDKYVVLNVRPDEIYRYLSCCDEGLLFREKSPVNWVSRPTKMLEYISVGLKIAHNNTIECLTKSRSS